MNNEEKILQLLVQLNEKVDNHDKRFDRLDKRLDRVEERLDKVDKRLDRVEERLGKVEERLDKVEERLGKVEERLDKVEGHMEELDERSLRSAVALEGEVIPKLQLLYEGQVTLQETLAPKERVEVLEDEVITLKTMVKSLSNRLTVLEKAQ